MEGGRLLQTKSNVLQKGDPYISTNKGSSDRDAPFGLRNQGCIQLAILRVTFAESNDITIRVTAWDNSGNKSTPSKDGGLWNWNRDMTEPTAIVTYQDTVQPQHDKYFKADRVVGDCHL